MAKGLKVLIMWSWCIGYSDHFWIELLKTVLNPFFVDAGAEGPKSREGGQFQPRSDFLEESGRRHHYQPPSTSQVRVAATKPPCPSGCCEAADWVCCGDNLRSVL